MGHSQEVETRYRWVILALAVLAVFGALGLSRFSYTSILPFMQDGLRLSNSQAGGLATANLAGYMTMAILGGALASRFGPRYVISGGLLLASLGMVITGMAGSYSLALGGRFLSGIGAAGASVPGHTMATMWFPVTRRALSAGTAATGCSVGLVVVGPLIPFLMERWGPEGWRRTWLVLAAAVAVIALIALLGIRNRPHARHQVPRPSERDRPAGWRRIYFSPRVWHLGVVYFLFGFAYMAYLTFFTKRLIADVGYTAEKAGTLFMILGWASLACGLLWGWVADRIGRGRAMTLILLLQTLSYSLFALSQRQSALVASALLFGITAWGVPAIMAALCSDLVGPRMAPAAYGFLTVFHGLGQATGPYVAGKLADALTTFTTSYLMAAGVALCGALGIAAYRRVGTRAEDVPRPEDLPGHECPPGATLAGQPADQPSLDPSASR